ncbi:hypothetical protein AWC31_14250 [Mycolicibacterium wolinskyi]|uniref:Type VII secretion protein EccE n=1 Tax=Mycolicibacterium wolinskyi TaxID=59750 RepID=A0A1X2FJ32_9MYCO|nr:hypothetical protein AWC31_14250 [Mycolicibacterium wolinskyi]
MLVAASLIMLVPLMALGHVPPIAFLAIATTAICVVLTVLVKFRGASMWQWRRIRRNGNTPVVFCQYGSHNGIGWAWDGAAMNVWVEVSPAQPFALTTVSSSGAISGKHIDLERLAKKMRQRDIVCESIRVVTHGYRTALPIGHSASAAVSDAIGPVPVHTGGRTFAVVTVATMSSLSAIRARAKDGGIPAAAWEAASRVRVELEAQGFTARIMSEKALRALGSEQAAQVASALEHIHSNRLGDASSVKVFSVVAQGSSWSARSQHLARQIPAHRIYENLAIVRENAGTLRAGYTASYVSQSDRIVRSLKGAGLRAASRQQVGVLAQTMPPAAGPAPAIPLHPIADSDMPVAHPGGAGMYLGSSPDLGRCFLRVDPASGRVLWLVGSRTMAQHMVLRMAIGTAPITVEILKRADGSQQWEEFVRRVNSPLLTIGAAANAGIVVCPAAEAERLAATGATVIAFADHFTVQPEFSIVENNGSLVATTGHNQVTVPWSMTAEERRYLPGMEARARKAVEEPRTEVRRPRPVEAPRQDKPAPVDSPTMFISRDEPTTFIRRADPQDQSTSRS